MMDRGLFNAVGISLLVHGLVLGLGGGAHSRVVEAPRLIEARLAPEPPPAQPPEPPRPQSVRPAAPVAEPLRPARLHPSPPVARPAPAPRLVTEQRSELSPPVHVPSPSPSVVSALALASDSALPASPAAPSRAGAAAGPPAGAGPAAYSPPGFGASYLHNPKPAYPLMARRRGLEGVVRLDVRVSAEGIPTAVKVRDSSGHESLDEAALTAVWHWRFSPARRGGEPVEGAVVVPVRFNLEGDTSG